MSTATILNEQIPTYSRSDLLGNSVNDFSTVSEKSRSAVKRILGFLNHVFRWSGNTIFNDENTSETVNAHIRSTATTLNDLSNSLHEINLEGFDSDLMKKQIDFIKSDTLFMNLLHDTDELVLESFTADDQSTGALKAAAANLNINKVADLQKDVAITAFYLALEAIGDNDKFQGFIATIRELRENFARENQEALNSSEPLSREQRIKFCENKLTVLQKFAEQKPQDASKYSPELVELIKFHDRVENQLDFWGSLTKFYEALDGNEFLVKNSDQLVKQSIEINNGAVRRCIQGLKNLESFWVIQTKAMMKAAEKAYDWLAKFAEKNNLTGLNSFLQSHNNPGQDNKKFNAAEYFKSLIDRIAN